jgi:hypothetical protein
MGRQADRSGKNKEVIFPMAQSKKKLLKLVHRRCQKAGRAFAYTAYKVDDIALLDAYGQLRWDIKETMQTLRQPVAADLNRSGTSPVTFQQVARLRE